MSPEQLVAAALAARAFWVPLAEGRRVRVRRPSEHDVRGLLKRGADGSVVGISADLPEVKRYAIDWEGFRECDLVAGGSTDPVAFHSDVFAVWIEDRRDDMAAIAQALVDAVIAHETARQDSAKN